MQLFSHVYQSCQDSEPEQKRADAHRIAAPAQISHQLFKSYALQPNIHVSVTYVIIPSQVFLIIVWY